MAKLKVFRTPIGFHDAYVAAPSRKAALAAWGADKDLFARGVAEEVTDAALTEAPLARPGEVVKVSRGDRDAQLAALPEDKPKTAAKRKGPKVAKVAQTKAKPPPPPKPKPSRADLDAAEEALTEAEARHEDERAALAKEEAALERRKREMKRAQEAEVARLERARESADADFREALAGWRSTSG
jgi:hypothetical protein